MVLNHPKENHLTPIKELVHKLSKFIYADKKRRADYWSCAKKKKKKLGKYPFHTK